MMRGGKGKGWGSKRQPGSRWMERSRIFKRALNKAINEEDQQTFSDMLVKLSQKGYTSSRLEI